MRYLIYEIWRDTYFDVIEDRHIEIRKMKIKDANIFNTVDNINISHNKTTGLRNNFNN
jgi:hypothetical protein